MEMSVIGPVQSRPVIVRQSRRKKKSTVGFVEKVGFEPGVKDRRSDGESGDDEKHELRSG